MPGRRAGNCCYDAWTNLAGAAEVLQQVSIEHAEMLSSWRAPSLSSVQQRPVHSTGDASTRCPPGGETYRYSRIAYDYEVTGMSNEHHQ